MDNTYTCALFRTSPTRAHGRVYIVMSLAKRAHYVIGGRDESRSRVHTGPRVLARSSAARP